MLTMLLVGTGCKVQLIENGEVKDEVTVVIKGEIDGNGKIDSDDAIYLLRNTLFASLYPVVVDDDVDGNGEYKDQTGDGRLTAVDKTIIGNTQPKVFGAFNTTLSYKDFLLDLQLDGAAGFSLLNMNRMIADNETMVSEKYAERADFLRLGRVSFAWNIPYFKDVRWIDSARITLSAYNLFTVSRYDGWNPDVNSFGISNLSTGFDYGSYPVARTILLGVGFNF